MTEHKIIFENIAKQIDQSLEDKYLAEPILYTLRAKMPNSIAALGPDCFSISRFTSLSDKERLQTAAATELAWICILIYDDIIDHDTSRYGQPAVWVKFGKEHATASYKYGLDRGREMHVNPKFYNQTIKNCISSQQQVKRLPLTAKVAELEQCYAGYCFGSFNFGLKFDDRLSKSLAKLGHLETLMGQFLNDYRDTCGSRRKIKNYPEIREKDLNYVIALYTNSLPNKNVTELVKQIQEANSSENYEKISQELTKQISLYRKKINELEAEFRSTLSAIENTSVRTALEQRLGERLSLFSEVFNKEVSS